jgi:hypothetical protein
MKKTKKNGIVSSAEQPSFDFKAEAKDRWNRRKGSKKTFVRW